MEIIIFAISFLFSFVIFLMGIYKNSFTLCLSGSLLLMLFSIVTIAMGLQSIETNTLNLNITNLDGTNSSYIIDTNNIGGVNDPYTKAFSLVMFVFSCFFMLYSLLYLRNAMPMS